ncbi:phage virion morphogenesis protein [Salipiger marinus]|uniref:phage virion morphogenesis protein n=1 Tax=Salipiger marinus TaxID=555512 RepID=UPI00405A44BA
MAVSLKVRFEDAAPRAALARAAEGARDLTELMDQIGSVLVNGAVERIGQTNVAPSGTPWPKSLRAQLGGGEDGEPGAGNAGPTLHDTGQLMRSITELPAPTQVTVGSNMIYAGVHQTGATIRPKTKKALSFTLANGDAVTVGSVTIPARPYLGISEEESADIEELSLQYFADLLDEELR